MKSQRLKTLSTPYTNHVIVGEPWGSVLLGKSVLATHYTNIRINTVVFDKAAVRIELTLEVLQTIPELKKACNQALFYRRGLCHLCAIFCATTLSNSVYQVIILGNDKASVWPTVTKHKFNRNRIRNMLVDDSAEVIA